MATSNLIPLHAPKKGTAKTTIYRMINYVKNPEKRRAAISIPRMAAILGLRRRSSST